MIEEENIKEKIRKAQKGDKRAVKAVEKLKWSGMKTLKNEEWSIKEELVLKENWIYIPEKRGLRTEIIQLYYDIPVEGHGGRWKMVELVRKNYWWPGIMKEVRRYINRCNVYQKNKNCTEALVEKLIPEKPWKHISVDFITKLPLVQEYNMILVVYNQFTKMAYFIAIYCSIYRSAIVLEIEIS